MKLNFWTFSLIVLLLSVSSSTYAGKVDDVKKIIKEKCNKDIPDETLMESVLKAYDCHPQTDVTIQGCTIKCLNTRSGKVVGE